MSESNRQRLLTACVYAKEFVRLSEKEIELWGRGGMVTFLGLSENLVRAHRQDCAIQLEAALNALDEE